MQTRVVVTGMGAVTPAGVGTEPLRTALQEGKCFVRRLEGAAFADLPCQAGASIPDFDAAPFIGKKNARRLDRSGQLFAVACLLACEDAKVFTGAVDRNRFGIFEGASLGGLQTVLREHKKMLERGAGCVKPTALNAAMQGAATGLISEIHGLHGPSAVFTNGSVASSYAITAAADAIRLNRIDLALAGGGEAPLFPEIFALFCRAGVLATGYASPETACRPFDENRNGTVLGEAGGALLLERLEHAERRGAKIYAEISGSGQTSDGHNIIAPAPGGEQQARAMRLAIDAAGLRPADIDYVSAHGTGTILNDRIEALAIERAFGALAKSKPVSSSKAMFGHSLGACSAVEVIKTILCIRGAFLPPTINLRQPDPACHFDLVPNQTRPARIRRALVNNSSFGGKNAAIVVSRCGVIK